MRIVLDRTWDDQPAPASEWVVLDLELGDGLEIEVNAPWHGDPAPSGPAGSRDALWEHEVVEIFLVGAGPEPVRYTEIELGPHGHHLGLQLEGVRCPVRTGFPIDWQVRRDKNRWYGRARIEPEWLPDPVASFNAFAIHGTGERRYLAYSPVPGDGPDFHRLPHFAPWVG